jgi:hypothetical protein
MMNLREAKSTVKQDWTEACVHGIHPRQGNRVNWTCNQSWFFLRRADLSFLRSCLDSAQHSRDTSLVQALGTAVT